MIDGNNVESYRQLPLAVHASRRMIPDGLARLSEEKPQDSSTNSDIRRQRFGGEGVRQIPYVKNGGDLQSPAIPRAGSKWGRFTAQGFEFTSARRAVRRPLTVCGE